MCAGIGVGFNLGMLRGLRNRSSTRRSQVVSSSDEEDHVVSGNIIVKQQPALVKDNVPSSNTDSEPKHQAAISRSTVSLSSSSDGSMFSSESPIVDDNDQDKLAHESYLNGTIPDLEDILRSFGSKSRKSNTRSGRYDHNKSILNTPTVLDSEGLGDDDDDRNSNNSSYNSGFSSSSDSSYESIPDTTQIAAFYNKVGVSSSPSEVNSVTLSPTSSTADIHHYSVGWSEENVPHKAIPSSRNKPKRQRRRSERRRRSRLSKPNQNNATSEGEATCNEDDNRSRQSFLSRTNSLISTRKSFGKNWTRKKRIDQVVANLSDSETKEKLFSVEPVHHRKTEPLIDARALIIDQEVTPMPSSPTSTKSETEPAIVTYNNTVTKVLIARSKISHVIERFDCDTGELISDIVVDNGTATGVDQTSKRSSSPTSSPRSSEGRQFDPLALSEVICDNDSPQKSCGSSGDHVVNYSIANATNVIENMVLLFARSDVEGIRRLLGESLESSVSSLSTNSSTLSRIIVLNSSNDEGVDIEDDGSDDKGGSDKQKAKHLRASKLLSLKETYKQSSKSLQAQFATNDYTLPLSMRGIVTHYSISILLIEPIHKVFEIVTVDVTRNMTLKETLVNACIAAADPILAEQTYISLCSDVKVLSNMSSPVSKLIQKPTDFSKKENFRSNNDNMLDREKQKEALMRREMERQLLVAVPLKSNFKECQMIRRILWKNTKLQLWWTTYQMKNEHYETPWSTAPASSQSIMKLPQPITI